MKYRMLLPIACVLLFFPIFLFADDISSDDCMECHSDKELVTEDAAGHEISLFVDHEKFSNSTHGGFECIDCHANIEELPHEEALEKPNCNSCHDDVEEEYLKSYHGMDLEKGDPDAPYCWDCHTAHYVYPNDDELSLTHAKNQPSMCGRCHSNPELVQKHHIPISEPSIAYTQSIHYKTILNGDADRGATCSDCHSAHNLQPSNNPSSKIYRQNIPGTCSTCHEEITAVYMESIHGQGLLKGASDAPVCTDCHSEHSIKDHTDPTSTVYSTVISKTTCPQCHEVARINAKYGMKGAQVSSYNDSYHGLANQAGNVVTANCASCHGVHDIRPSDDPKSKINKANLAKTCGRCHPGVTDNVALGSVHINPSPESDEIVYYVKIFYVLLIVSVIGGMIIHNGLDLVKKSREKMHSHSEIDYTTSRQFVRLTVNERIQHFLLMSSFTILVITGFALVYPESLWAVPFKLWEGGFVFRGQLHRFAAGTMLFLAIYHVFYLITTRRGKRHFVDFLPTLQDAKDVLQMFKYYLGLSKEKPKFGRYNYMEKAEYWALIWGTVVMSLTGIVLWFENDALKYFPKWAMDVSTTIHFYEALLATLAILVWHFYYQFFDPHVYPMNTTCLTGKMSEKAMKDEHPVEYEKLTTQKDDDKSW